MTDVFAHDAPLARHGPARAEDLNAIFTAIERGFERLAGLKRLFEGKSTWCATAKGTANAIKADPPRAPAAYGEGLEAVFVAKEDNTGAATIDLNALGATALRRFDGAELRAGEIRAATVCVIRRAGAAFRLLSPHALDVAYVESLRAQGEGARWRAGRAGWGAGEDRRG